MRDPRSEYCHFQALLFTTPPTVPSAPQLLHSSHHKLQTTQTQNTSNLIPPHAHPQPNHAHRAPPQPTRAAQSLECSSLRRPELRGFFNVSGPRKPKLSTKQKLTKPNKIKLRNLNISSQTPQKSKRWKRSVPLGHDG